MTVTIMRGDARHLALADNSVDLICTSPPYFGLRSYQDGGEHYSGQLGDEATPAEFVDALIACTAEWMRVLKPSGSMWINLGDKYANPSVPGNRDTLPQGGRPGQLPSDGHRSAKQTVRRAVPLSGVKAKSLYGIPWRYALRCIDDLGLILRSEVIWSKPNGLPESVTDRVRRSHEQWFMFTLEPRYFSAVDEIREAHVEPRLSKIGSSGSGSLGSLGKAHTGTVGQAYNPLGKLPGSVWTVPTEPLRVPESLGIDHFAAFPTRWPERIVSGWSEPDMTVLDPFGGTGTTALVAHALGRHGISNDMSADYCRLAAWRTSDPGQIAKVRGERKPVEQIDGQEDLFGEVSA